MAWKIKWSAQALKALKKLDKKRQTEILQYMRKRIATASDPQDFGKPLRYDKFGLWRYRVQDSRIICQLQEKTLIVLVLNVGHRKTVYTH